jgi:lipopolysaccharide transport system permease protein
MTPFMSDLPLRKTQDSIGGFMTEAGMSFGARSRMAWQDVVRGTQLWPLAWSLASLDIRLRYRGSVLGPFWLTISTGIMIASLGFLYSSLFGMSLKEYLPYLAISQILWGLLASAVNDAGTCFTESESVIRSMRMPYFVFSIRIAMRDFLVFAHNLVIIAIVFAIYCDWPGWGILFAPVGLAIWLADILALNLTLGAICARFRDIQQIISSIMQIAFFLTPVIWKPEQLGDGAKFLPLSPFYNLIEIVRGPLLSGGVAPEVWAGALGYSALLWLLAAWFFIKARGRIVFWL